MAKIHFLVVLLIIASVCPIDRVESIKFCEDDEFECKDGSCIAVEKVCDTHRDCIDNSDEKDCDFKLCRKPNYYQCSDDKTCIPVALVCNGDENCPDGGDERQCSGLTSTTLSNCTDTEYTCQDRSCIPLHFMCDGKKDCHDGTDETEGCLKAEHECSGFFCQNRKCLESHQWVCDGIDDCGDGSDEKGCVWNCKLERQLFLCHDNDTCIDLDKVCDGKYDCHDQSDENGKCKDTTLNCESKRCPKESTCHQLSSGPECLCPSGYQYNSVRNSCEDINECETYGICSQGCINTEGSYMCSCDEKYKLKADNKTCVVKSGEPLLLYTTKESVVGMYLKTRHLYTVANNLSFVVGVAYDGLNIYWTNINQEESESIVKAREDGSKQETLLTSGLDTPEDLAVDWLTGNIYFSDNVLRHIAVCSNNGHYCMPLVVIDVHQPRGIALWPQKGLMYWTDWGMRPMIARASMDGADPVALVKSDIHWPNGVTLDIPNGRFYWVDAKLKTIESAKMDGSERRLVLSDILKHPYGIAVFEDNLYWSDWGTKSVHTCHKFTGKGHEVLAKDRRIYAVHVYHSASQPKVNHPCKDRRCSHLCLLASNNTATCGCPDGMTLAIDRTRCTKTMKKQKLYVGMKNIILEMEHTTFGRHKVLQEHALSLFIHQMAYNSVNGTLLIADTIQKLIVEYDTVAKEMRVLVRGNIGNITGMAFDQLAQNLYWTDSERHTVETYSMRTRHRAIVHFFSGIDVPMGIGLLPDEGKMFIALKSSKSIHIDLKTLGGHGEHTHVFEDIFGMGAIQIVPDYETHTLYWVDTEGGKIEFALLDELHNFPLRTRLAQPISMALIDDDIFWTTLRSPNIYWTHKSNLGSVKKFQLEVSSTKLVDKIQLLSSQQQTIFDHPCLHDNGGCSHVCVSAGKNSLECLCPSGYVFKDSWNQTCIEALDCEFRCKSGECLTNSRRCNGHKDCPDGSDEESCDLKAKKTHVICAFDEFMCHDSLQCVLNEVRCNKQRDCKDGSDEEHCENFDDEKKCHVHQFSCDNGRCIDLSSMCDGFDDCGDRSDETHCNKGGEGEKPACGGNMFQCASGTCIAKSWECDGHVDCVDGSDEHFKCTVKTCGKGMHKCNIGQCIDEKLVCDGHNDCGDNSDELICVDDKPKITCGSGDDEFEGLGKSKKFQCPSDPTICLDIRAKCNGTAECPRGEDEAGCHGCSVNEFQCKSNKECIRSEFHCDGDKDCHDGSDELNCGRYNSSTHSLFVKACEPGMFDCKDGTCIDESRTCDGKDDCENGQDETSICKTACVKGTCDHKCRPTPFGAKCSCFDGYRLDTDQKKCIDINECIEGPNPCAQLCENTNGAYRCICYSGFMLTPDKVSCKSIDSRYSLFFTTHNEIRSLTESPITLKVVWSVNDTKISGLDVDIGRRKLFYTTEEGNAVFQFDIEKQEVSQGLFVQSPTKVAVDWITGNVYVISRMNSYRIKVCSFGQKMCADLIKLPTNEVVRSIAVDAVGRKLFYASVLEKAFSSPKTYICIAGLDGSKHAIIATREALVTALEVDTYKQEVYFVDAHSRTLQSLSYRRGSDRSVKTVVRRENAIIHPSSLSIHENIAFIVNTGAKEAVRCHLYGNASCQAFYLNVFNAEDIVVDSSSRQKLVKNICNHKRCSGLCVQGPFAYECMCQDGSIVDEYFQCSKINSNEISSGLFANEDAEEASTASTTAIVWYTLLGILIVAGVVAGYLYYAKNNQGHRNFNINMHFQNPLSRFQNSSSAGAGGTGTTGFSAGEEKLQFNLPIPRLLRNSKGSELVLDSKREAKNVNSAGNTGRSSSSILLEEPDADNSGGLANFDDDQRTRLVP